MGSSGVRRAGLRTTRTRAAVGWLLAGIHAVGRLWSAACAQWLAVVEVPPPAVVRWRVCGRRLALLAVAVTLALPAAAGAVPHRDRFRTVARGLDNPRGLAFLPSGNLAVAEAGHAGTLCLAPGQCVGLSGRVIAIDPSQHRRAVLATGVPSLGGPFAPFGLGGLTVQRGKLYSIVGLNPQAFGNPATDCQGQPDVSSCVTAVTAVQNGVGFLNRVRSTDANRGYEGVAGVGRFDFDYTVSHPDPGNPDYMPGDADPFGLIAGPRGGFYVVDGASNTLDFVTKRGDVSVLAFVPDPPNHQPIYDAAPTCAARTQNGDVYVGTESNSLYRWDGKTLTEVLRGGKLGQVVGCTADSRGNIYLANLASMIGESSTGFIEKPFDGSIVKVTPDRKTSYVAKGLNYPTGLTLGPDDHLYVDVNGLCPHDLLLLTPQNSTAGGCPASGKVVRLDRRIG
jgi:hypothetical protein